MLALFVGQCWDHDRRVHACCMPCTIHSTQRACHESDFRLAGFQQLASCETHLLRNAHETRRFDRTRNTRFDRQRIRLPKSKTRSSDNTRLRHVARHTIHLFASHRKTRIVTRITEQSDSCQFHVSVNLDHTHEAIRPRPQCGEI